MMPNKTKLTGARPQSIAGQSKPVPAGNLASL
jgi:hypothetical protein